MKSGPNMTPVTPSILNKFLQKNEMEMSIMTFLTHFYIHMNIKSSTAIQSLNPIYTVMLKCICLMMDYIR